MSSARKPPADAVLEVLEHLYEAAIRPEQLVAALDGINHLLQGRAAHAYTYDRATGQVVEGQVDSEPTNQRAIELYVTEWGEHDPQSRLSARLPSGTVVRSHEYFDEEFVRGSPYYQDFLIPFGYRWAITGMLHQPDGTSTVVGGLRAPDAPPFEPWAAEVLSALLPHLRLAGALRQQIASAAAASPGVVQLVEHLPAAALLVDDRGRVLLQNLAAASCLSEMPLQLAGSCIRFNDPEMHRAWLRTLGRARRTLLAATMTAYAEPHAAWVLHLVPWKLLAQPSDACELSLNLLTIERQGGPTRRQVENFAVLFGLSAAEKDVLDMLLQGRSPKEVAKARGSSVHTVRTQVARVLDKTGSRSMRELIARASATRALPQPPQA